jgi:hypothetical protein
MTSDGVSAVRDAGGQRHPRRPFAMVLLAAVLGLTTGAREPGTADPRAPAPTDYAPVVLHVACGALFQASCGRVLPRIAARTGPMGLDLEPVASGSALDTAAAVCQGQAAAAIVARDTAVALSHEPACLGRYDVVGRALFPLYAFLVVRADAPFRSLDDFVGGEPRHTVAAGAEGSGGQMTLGFLLRSNAAWQRAIAVSDDDADTALERIEDGSIDGLFLMEPLDSPMVDQVRVRTDARGKPVFMFIDLRPGPDLFRVADGGGHCLYRLTALDFGGPFPVTTVSADAVMILARAFREAHARSGPFAADALASAIEAVQAGMLADTKSPGGWRPAAASCQ